MSHRNFFYNKKLYVSEDHKPSWQAYCKQADQEISQTWWNLKVHCRVYNSLSFDPTLSMLTEFNLVPFNILSLSSTLSVRLSDRNCLNLETTVFWDIGVSSGNLLPTIHTSLQTPSSGQSGYFVYSILLCICACPTNLTFLDLVNIKVICE